MMPHLGVLSTLHPDVALEVLFRDCLVPLGTCVSPVGGHDGKAGHVTVELRRAGRLTGGSREVEERKVYGGKLAVIPLAAGEEAEVVFQPSLPLNLGRGPGVAVKARVRGGAAGLVVDLRGRPLASFDHGELGGGAEDARVRDEFASSLGGGFGSAGAVWAATGNGMGSMDPTGKPARFGPITKVRRLPYSGRVLVTEGQQVAADTPVARLEYLPGRLARLDVGKELLVLPSDVPDTLLKRVGDSVRAGEVVAAAAEFGRGRVAASPVEGIVGLVSKRLGYVYLREPIPTGGREPVVINVLESLGIGPTHFRRALRVDPRRAAGGRLLLEKGVVIASWEDRAGHFRNVVAPIYGYLSAVDPEGGTVTLRPFYTSTEVLAYVPGIVAATAPGESVTIETMAHLVPGVFGVGGERFGRLRVLRGTGTEVKAERALEASQVPADCGGLVLAWGGWVTQEALEAAANAGAAGVVAGGCRQKDLVSYLGGEFEAGVTGNENVTAAVVLTGGFGQVPMAKETWAAVLNLDGRQVSLNGATHLRAGVVRPEVIISPASPSA